MLTTQRVVLVNLNGKALKKLPKMEKSYIPACGTGGLERQNLQAFAGGRGDQDGGKFFNSQRFFFFKSLLYRDLVYSIF